MSDVTVVTGWGPTCWKTYAPRFVETFSKFAAANVKCVSYIEEPQERCDRIEFRLLSDIRGCIEFLDRHRDNLSARGRNPLTTWKPAERDAGYSFKFDAWKFCRQGFIPLHAAERCDTEIMIWFDADVVFNAAFDANRLAALVPQGAAVSYLGRPPKHSEIGFQGYRLPGAMPHLSAFSAVYANDAVFGLREWHSAYVFDRALETSGVKAENLTPNGSGNVWLQCPQLSFSEHLKGKRKFRK